MNNTQRKSSTRLPIFVAAVLAISFLLWHLVVIDLSHLLEWFDLERIQSVVDRSGPLGALTFIAIASLAELLTIPFLPLAAVGGIVFGKAFGFLYSVLAVSIGASLSFLISRHFLQGIAQREIFERFPRLHKLDTRLEEQGLELVASLRIIMPPPQLSWALATTRVRFRDYFIGSAIGYAPWVAAAVLFGNLIFEAESWKDLFTQQTVLIGSLLFVGFGGLVYLVHQFVQRLHHDER